MEKSTPSIHNIRTRQRLENGMMQELHLRLAVDPSSCPLTTDTEVETEASETVAQARPVEKETRKVIRTDRTITLKRGTNMYTGNFRIANISKPGQPVLFKITTTHATLFTVRPIIGLIYPNKQGTINVYGLQNIPEAELERAKFRVAALPILFDQIEDNPSDGTRENVSVLKRVWSKKLSESPFQPQFEDLNVAVESLTPVIAQNAFSCEEIPECDENYCTRWGLLLVVFLAFLVVILLCIFTYFNLTKDLLEPLELEPPKKKVACFGTGV